jgi:type II secretory pathway component PulF
LTSNSNQQSKKENHNAIFTYKARSSEGKSIIGNINANDLKSAKNMLATQKLLVISIHEQLFNVQEF